MAGADIICEQPLAKTMTINGKLGFAARNTGMEGQGRVGRGGLCAGTYFQHKLSFCFCF